MGEKWDKMLDAAGWAAGNAAKAAAGLVGRGLEQADRLAVRRKLAKTQRQLGALVYQQHKTGAADEGRQAYYIEQIDVLKTMLDDEETPPQKPVSVHKWPQDDETEAQEDAMFCGGGKP